MCRPSCCVGLASVGVSYGLLFACFGGSRLGVKLLSCCCAQISITGFCLWALCGLYQLDLTPVLPHGSYTM